MTQSATFASPIANPLRGRDSWPHTGPIYGFSDDLVTDAPQQTRSLWQRLTAPYGAPQPEPTTRRSIAPVWY